MDETADGPTNLAAKMGIAVVVSGCWGMTGEHVQMICCIWGCCLLEGLWRKRGRGSIRHGERRTLGRKKGRRARFICEEKRRSRLYLRISAVLRL